MKKSETKQSQNRKSSSHSHVGNYDISKNLIFFSGKLFVQSQKYRMRSELNFSPQNVIASLTRMNQALNGECGALVKSKWNHVSQKKFAKLQFLAYFFEAYKAKNYT